jgi:hypothetical protein
VVRWSIGELIRPQEEGIQVRDVGNWGEKKGEGKWS